MLRNETLGERVYKEIKKFVIDGHYSLGQRLMYDEVSKELGVSQTPVKEAFLRLEREGLVETIARRGTFVKEFTNKDLREYLEIRHTLEVFALDKALANIKPEDISEMRKINNKLLESVRHGKNEEVISADAEFHNFFTVASNNEKLMQLMNTLPLTNLFSLAGRGEFFIKNGETYYNEHAEIIDQIEKGNTDEAKRLLDMHLREGIKNTTLSETPSESAEA